MILFTVFLSLHILLLKKGTTNILVILNYFFVPSVGAENTDNCNHNGKIRLVIVYKKHIFFWKFKLGDTLTGGPGFVHNFRVKVPGATSFTNITAAGVYCFNRDTLKLTDVPLSFKGYQFRDSISTGANCGSVISTVATLTVNPIPVVTISAAPRRNYSPV